VVHGAPAIAAAIDRGVVARATPLAKGPSRMRVERWGTSVSEHDDDDLGRAFTAALASTRAAGGLPDARSWFVDVDVQLPPGGGLGCSAAIGVAVHRALDPLVGDLDLRARVMAWEQVFHGNPSGVDGAVCAGGGFVHFQKGSGVEPLHTRSAFTLCIGNSGAPSSTKAMVESVTQLRERSPALVDKSFEAIATLVRNARLAIEAGDRVATGRLMDLNQMLLSGLFLSTPEIEQMCELARTSGALGAKLTGAGGGGSVVALVFGAAAAERVVEAWRQGGSGFVTRVAGRLSAPSLGGSGAMAAVEVAS
jgi:mevalonate kinase